MFSGHDGVIARDGLARAFRDLADERIIYVCAPAGYGKTVAVRQWLSEDHVASAFISLDESDNSLPCFCQRFCAALSACQPENELLAEIVSHPAFGGAPDQFSLRAIAALAETGRAVLAFDDLHLIHDEQVLSLLLIFLKRIPAGFQTVLISRSDLPPRLSDLWIKGELARLSSDHLAFCAEEIISLYRRRGHVITSEQAEDVLRYTGGWAIGINALLLSGEAPFGSRFGYLEEFIRAHVWCKWDAPTQEFLLRTAMARDLSPSLCNVLAGISDSDRVLKELTRTGAFISRARDGVYHYHHLFQNFLQTMLKERGEAYLFSLLREEGGWHLSRQDFYRAAECFIRCGNYDGIAKCFDLLEVTDRNEFVIEKMLPIIEHPEIRAAAERYPFLYYLMAWAACAEGRAQDMALYMDRYYARYPEVAARDPVHAHNIYYMRIFDFRVPIAQLIREAAALPPRDIKGAQGSITMHLPFFHRSVCDFSELAQGDPEANIAEIRAAVGWLFGEEVELIAESLASGLLYERGSIDKAYLHALAANTAIRRHFSPELKFCAMSALVNVLDALGQQGEADQVIKGMASRIEQDRAYYLTRSLDALMVNRRLARGETEAALGWLSRNKADRNDCPTLHGSYAAFTTARAYIVCGQYDAAILLLTKLLALARSFERTLDRIEGNLLLSIAYWKKKRGFQGEAIRLLGEAVSAAYEAGYRQLFINEGAALAGMLRRLHRSVVQRGGPAAPASFIKQLYLKTLENQSGGLLCAESAHPAKYTEKQKRVMRLLCEGNSYREISEKMGIKLPTLRSHIALIYKKLDVTCETDAILKIQAQRVLEDQ